jgi:Uma2 family endonuclease
VSDSARRKATLEDFWAIPEGERFHELIAGEIVEKAAPSGEHARVQFRLGVRIGPYDGRGGGSGASPGGWWFGVEAEILLGADIVRPDIAGWRRDRHPEQPVGMPVSQVPDWVCEVLSPSNAKNDTIKKLRVYHQNHVEHYWLVDPRDATLTVMHWNAEGYVTRLRAERGEVLRAEPFDAIEIPVGVLFGDDPP